MSTQEDSPPLSEAAEPALPVHPVPAPIPQPETYPFKFTGHGGEYFRIWIVNLLLIVLTLGIYAAWAKVRREQYFHRNLVLDNSGFDFHGEPKAILVGQSIALVIGIALAVGNTVGPYVYAVILLVLLPAIPWLVVRAMRFRAHNTSYRGLRFSFHGTYRDAAIAFLGYGVLAIVTLGILFPAFYRQMRLFILNNLRYGSAEFRCEASLKAFYFIFAMPVLAVLGLIASLVIFSAMGGAMLALLPFLVFVAFLGFQVFLGPYIRVKTSNLVWNNTKLDSHSLESSLTVLRYTKIVFLNLIGIILTFGLFWPWAQVRIARYRASCLSLHTVQALDAIVAGELIKAPAVGDAASDMFDIDVAL